MQAQPATPEPHTQRTTPVLIVGTVAIPETLLPVTPAWHAVASALVDGLASIPGGVRPWMIERDEVQAPMTAPATQWIVCPRCGGSGWIESHTDSSGYVAIGHGRPCSCDKGMIEVRASEAPT